MEKNEVLNKLQDIIREAVDDDEIVINEKSSASDIEGWDSLAQVLIVGEIQNELGVKFTSTEIGEITNVGELAEAIIAKL